MYLFLVRFISLAVTSYRPWPRVIGIAGRVHGHGNSSDKISPFIRGTSRQRMTAALVVTIDELGDIECLSTENGKL